MLAALGWVLVSLFPLLIGILAFVLVCLCHDLSLFEEGYGWSDTFIKVFLVDFGPVGISRLLSNRNAFENLLGIRFESGEIVRCENC
jgi:hypothetical protein